MGNTTGDDNFGITKWIVNPTAGAGTHTTIAGVNAVAVSGDDVWIAPGTYTENPALIAGVNYIASPVDGLSGQVIINGTCTFSSAGTVNLTGMRLQTNASTNLLSVTGSAASIVNLKDCYLNCSSNTGISFTTSNASAQVNCYQCRGDVGTTGIAIFASSSTGGIRFVNSGFTNTGGSSTASTISAGVFGGTASVFSNPLTSSGTAIIGMTWCQFDTSAQNAVSLTFGGSGTSTLIDCSLMSGSGASISTTQNTNVSNITITSTNTNPITGAGALFNGGVSFLSSGVGINTSTHTSDVMYLGSLTLNTALTVANGGTGRATLTNHGVLVGATTTAITQLAAGSAGQVLQSGGASADPAYSTSTFPTTATGTGTILRADGTNWVATTSTYPNTNAINTLLYASSANVMAALTTANTAILSTDGSGVPSITTTPACTSITLSGGTALSAYVEGTFTPTMIGTVAGATTYTVQLGYYRRIGNLVQIQATTNGSAATGTGNIVFGGLPFTVKNQANGNAGGSVVWASVSTWTFPASTTAPVFSALLNSTTGTIWVNASAGNAANQQMFNATFSFNYNVTHEI